MTEPPFHRLRHEHSGSSNDVEYSPIPEDRAGTMTSQTAAAPRRDRQSIAKRPYRQRRKDPSCDACRERKVKCDASDAGACSECYTRGVPCCFTKESNRRMSSLRQIQDLEERLSRAKQEIVQLRMSLGHRRANSNDDLSRLVQSSALDPASEKVDSQSSMQREEAALVTAMSWRRPTTCIYVEELPPQQTTLSLLRIYEQIVHSVMPVVPLHGLQKEIEKLYQHGKLDGVPQAWRGMFLTMLALAMQATPQPNPAFSPEQLIQLAIASVDQTWSGSLSLDHVRMALLVATYFYEEALHTASLLWFNTACALARQRLEQDAEALSKSAIYLSLDWFRLRFAALHPVLPNVTDYSSPEVLREATGHTCSDTIQALLQVIPPSFFDNIGTDDVASLRSFELGIATIIDQTSSVLDPASSVPLAQADLYPALAVQMVRMLAMLQRLDHSTLGHALIVAEDTVQLIRRSMMDSKARTSSDDSQGFYQSLHFLHLWRCQMVLCLGGRLESAKTLIGISAAVGDHRKANKDCALCLTYFLDQLINSLEAGADPSTDGRLLALVKDSLDKHIVRANTAYQLQPATRRSISLRRDSSDETVVSEAKDETPGDDHWNVLEKKLARLDDMRQSRFDAPSPTISSPQSSRSRMQISNILK